jgi:UDP-N-acetylglucosamine 3-dehydrogenase
VVIATPTHTHADLAIYAAKKGKHIFLEKPMARTVEECNDIIKAAKDNNVKLFIGHVLRFWPSYSSIKCHLDVNPQAIGPVKMMRLLRLSGIPSWSDWFLDVKKSGGVVLDLSIHDIDYALLTFNKMPQSVYCDTKKMDIKGFSVPVISSTTLQFDKGIAYCEASWACKSTFPFTSNAEIIGETGLVKFDSNSTIPINIYSNTERKVMDPYSEDGYYWEMDSFITSILNNKDPSITGVDGKKAVAICIAAIKSSEENILVKVSEVLK